MKIAVLSDTHDNIWQLAKAIQLIKENTCSALIFCGDFCSPFTAEHINSLNVPTYACFGNNDEDHLAIVKKTTNWEFWPLTKEFAEIELDKKKIAFCHYPKLARLLALTQNYSAVFHGHTHESYVENIDQTLLANPGAVCGIIKGKPGQSSFGIYDTQKHSFDLIKLD